jgi:hypothetical protein
MTRAIEKTAERLALEDRVLALCDTGITYQAIGDKCGVSRCVVSGILYRHGQPTRQKQYVTRLHDLLWQFVERHDPKLTGDVVNCAEIVLAAEDPREAAE